MYNPAEYFFDGPVRPEPTPRLFREYRPRTFADVAARIGQSYRGVPEIAPRIQPDTLCVRCGVERAYHGKNKSPRRDCARFLSPYPRNKKRKNQNDSCSR